MVLAPNDLFSWNNNTTNTMLTWVFTLIAGYSRWLLLCAWSFPEAVMGSSSLLPLILLRLLTSPVQIQLTLTGPYWGPRSPHPQSGIPSHRVRAHSLSRVQNTFSLSSSCLVPILCMWIYDSNNFTYVLFYCNSSIVRFRSLHHFLSSLSLLSPWFLASFTFSFLLFFSFLLNLSFFLFSLPISFFIFLAFSFLLFHSLSYISLSCSLSSPHLTPSFSL